MKGARDEYNVNIPTSWWSVLCALFGHQIYRSRTWYSSEWGCRRCGLHFEHRWDMFTSTGTQDG
jgi:hypothetical protein